MESKPSRVPLETIQEAHHVPPSVDVPAVPPVLPEDFKPVPPEELREKIVDAIRTCYDPELPVNIYELGLIYDIGIEPPGVVTVKMTLTSPACPAAASLPGEVQAKVKTVPGVASAKVDVVWEPTWTQDRMTEAARLQLGLF
jgi:FeS assembly SUF system protein